LTVLTLTLYLAIPKDSDYGYSNERRRNNKRQAQQAEVTQAVLQSLNNARMVVAESKAAFYQERGVDRQINQGNK